MESANEAAAILTQLFVLLVAAKIGDEIFKRLDQPSLIGEILGGVIVGPAVLNIYQVNAETSLFAEIGVVLLLFQVGLDTRLHDLLSVGRSALLVATLGVVFPLAAGFGLAELMGAPLPVAVFLGAALTAT
jgi:Kef-type K+ transport system membrane component KefB